MALRIVTGESPYEELEDGVYPAVLMEVQEDETTWEGEVRPQYRCIFELVDPPGVKLSYWVTRYDNVHPKSKLYGLLKALNGGQDLPAGWEGELEAFVGSKVRLSLREVTRAGGTTTIRVTDVLPYRERSRRAAVAED
jgi:hypothetical protein